MPQALGRSQPCREISGVSATSRVGAVARGTSWACSRSGGAWSAECLGPTRCRQRVKGHSDSSGARGWENVGQRPNRGPDSPECVITASPPGLGSSGLYYHPGRPTHHGNRTAGLCTAAYRLRQLLAGEGQEVKDLKARQVAQPPPRDGRRARTHPSDPLTKGQMG